MRAWRCSTRVPTAENPTEAHVGSVPGRVGLEVRNITNVRYREALSLSRYFADEVGREVWLRLEAHFEDVFSTGPATPNAAEPR